MSAIKNKKVLGILLLLLVMAVATVVYYRTPSKVAILDYVPARDRDQLLALFRKNWYWLIEADQYSPEYAFDYLTPKQEGVQYHGKLKVNVIRDGGEFIGFAAYYMQGADRGQLLFLAVDDSFWGKRYGQMLLEYSIEQLKHMGARTINLVTRTSNVRAQKLYKRVGFKQVLDDGHGFVYFEYKT